MWSLGGRAEGAQTSGGGFASSLVSIPASTATGATVRGRPRGRLDPGWDAARWGRRPLTDHPAHPERTHGLPRPGASPTPKLSGHLMRIPPGLLPALGTRDKGTTGLPSWGPEEGATCHTARSALSSPWGLRAVLAEGHVRFSIVRLREQVVARSGAGAGLHSAPSQFSCRMGQAFSPSLL